MTDLTRLETALRNADAAGDTEAATKLAQAIRSARVQEQPSEAQSRVQSERGIGQNIDNAVRSFVRGVPFIGSYADEASAGLNTGFGYLGDYSKELDYQRERDRDYDQQHPYASTAGKVVGGVATGVAAAPAIAATGIGAALPSTLGGRVLAGIPIGAAAGGAEGAVSGYGEGEGGNRAQSAGWGALKGAAVGAGVGGVAPIAAEGIGRGAQSVYDWATVGRRSGQIGMTPESVRVMSEALQGDDALAGPGFQRMIDAGPDAMIADAGPTVSGILDTAIQKSGQGGRIARQNVEARSAQSLGTMNRALDTALGPAQGVTARETGIRQGSAAGRGRAYEAAYNTPIDYARPEARSLEALLRRLPGEAVAAANNLMHVEGQRSRQILARVAQDGSVTFQRMPDVRQLDYITRGLREVADKADGQGKLGGTTAMGRAYGNLAREIRDTTGQLVPEYRTALATAADPIRRREALRLGEGALSPSITRDEFAEGLHGMTPAERRELATGIRSNIDDKVANVVRAVQDGNMDAREAIKIARDMSSRASREKVTLAIGQQEAQNLFREIDRATMGLELRARTADNSKTFARQTTDETIKRQIKGGPIATAARGEPVKAGKRLVQALTGRTEEFELGQERRIYSDIARLLTEPRGQNAIRTARQLSNLIGQSQSNVRAASRLARLLTSGGAGGAYQLTTQNTKP